MKTTPVIIYVNRQLDGVTFSLDPLSRKQLYAAEPNKRPSASIYIGYDPRTTFETYHKQVEPTILPALLGMNEQEIQELGEIDFVDVKTNEVLYRYPYE